MSMYTNIRGTITLNNKFKESPFYKFLEMVEESYDIDVLEESYGDIDIDKLIISHELIMALEITFDSVVRLENIFHALTLESNTNNYIKDNILNIDIDINHHEHELRVWLVLLANSIDDIDITLAPECFEDTYHIDKDMLADYILKGESAFYR